MGGVGASHGDFKSPGFAHPLWVFNCNIILFVLLFLSFSLYAFLMLTSLHLHMKSSEVCIKTKPPPASLPIQGQATKHTTVKWAIEHLTISFHWVYFATTVNRKEVQSCLVLTERV